MQKGPFNTLFCKYFSSSCCWENAGCCFPGWRRCCISQPVARITHWTVFAQESKYLTKAVFVCSERFPPCHPEDPLCHVQPGVHPHLHLTLSGFHRVSQPLLSAPFTDPWGKICSHNLVLHDSPQKQLVFCMAYYPVEAASGGENSPIPKCFKSRHGCWQSDGKVHSEVCLFLW